MMSSLASFVVRRRRAVIGVWALLLVLAGTVGSSAFTALSSTFGAGPSTEAGRVAEQLDHLASTGGEIAIIADGIALIGVLLAMTSQDSIEYMTEAPAPTAPAAR